MFPHSNQLKKFFYITALKLLYLGFVLRESYLDGIDIVGNHYKLCFFLFNEFGDGVGAGTDGVGAFGRFVLLLGDLGLGTGTQALFLLLGSFWSVLLQQFEQL